jgi:hypothetical protein
MSAGPTTCAAVLTTTTTMVSTTIGRTGRINDPSSLSERCLIWRLSIFE